MKSIFNLKVARRKLRLFLFTRFTRLFVFHLISSFAWTRHHAKVLQDSVPTSALLMNF